jgi:hypothetical protein
MNSLERSLIQKAGYDTVKTVFPVSNAAIFWRAFFQSLENFSAVFPGVGNFCNRFSKDWKLVFVVLVLCGCCSLGVASELEPGTAPCWTSVTRHVYFPANDPVFLDEDRVVLLRRGDHAYRMYLPETYDQFPSRQYPLAVMVAPLSDEQQTALAQVFCEQEWAMMVPELKASATEEEILAALIICHKDALKQFRLLPKTQLLAGYQFGAEMGAFFVATRNHFAAWIGDDVLISRSETNELGWLTGALQKRSELLLCPLVRESGQAGLALFRDHLSEETLLHPIDVAINTPLPVDAMRDALEWVRRQLLFEQPPDGRHYYYAEAEFYRMRDRLPETSGREHDALAGEMAILNERYHLNLGMAGSGGSCKE